MMLKAIMHEADEGGFWAEVPVIPNCVSCGEAMDERRANLREVIEGCLAVEIGPHQTSGNDRVPEIAVGRP